MLESHGGCSLLEEPSIDDYKHAGLLGFNKIH